LETAAPVLCGSYCSSIPLFVHWRGIPRISRCRANLGRNTMPPRNNRCSACHGSGSCDDCHGTGVNVHLHEAEPRCQACLGSGHHCSECAGTGLLRAADLHDMPILLRFLFSAIPTLILWKVLIAREPVHWGRGGLVLPTAVGQLSCLAIGGAVLYSIWKGVKRSDFSIRRNSGRISLGGIGESRTQGNTSEHRRPDPSDKAR
jgi:hypothetical protein